MAGHGNSGVSDQKQKGAIDDAAYINSENMQNNMKVIYYSRTFMSIIGGVIAGILGFTGLTGFVFYFLVMAVTSVGLTAKAKFSIHSYFDSWNRVLLDGFVGGLMSFVLFWTFAYDFVHIFDGLYSAKNRSKPMFLRLLLTFGSTPISSSLYCSFLVQKSQAACTFFHQMTSMF